ncbi:PepSY domain-containing protein [Belnapia sp. T6]|uniref:PepSY domain-containing protein n=1 Tax=Belnapia mucosa TaxID=2804532 RepID=A0ABS1VCR5_9PROT|nr:PepSY-associated TM helix domain-containing protein [Belnapia mucosa]MBL6459459.1 PepSY domain-containing protein [Belnapia mucosa]
MKGSFTRSMAWLHTWCGLLFGWLLFAVFLTGTLAIFEHEISAWMRPELRQANTAPREMALARAESLLLQTAPRATSWRITLPAADDAEPVVLRWREAEAFTTRYMNPATGEVIPVRDTEGGEFFVDFHANLMAGNTGLWIVAGMGMAMLAALVSGIVIHKRIFRDFFTFRPSMRAQRAWMDGHTLASVLALPFHLMITYTGLAMSFTVYMPVGITMFFDGSAAALRAQVVTQFERPAAHQPAEMLPLAHFLAPAEAILGRDSAETVVVRNPGDTQMVVEIFRRFDDRIAAVADHAAFDGVSGAPLGSQTIWNRSVLAWRVMVGLHMAQFGGDVLRWLYFLSGLASTAMIGSGLILFVLKRRVTHSMEASRFDHAVERVNVAAVAGVLIACLAYFWLNRLLPAGLTERGAWEMGLLLPIWLVTLLHAMLRPPARAWIEQISVAAVLSCTLPIVNLMTGGLPLAGAELGVDAAALGCGLAFGLLAWRMTRRSRCGRNIVAPTSGPLSRYR